MGNLCHRRKRSKISLIPSRVTSSRKPPPTAMIALWACKRRVNKLRTLAHKIVSLRENAKKSSVRRRKSVVPFASRVFVPAHKWRNCNAVTYSRRVVSIAGWSRSFSAPTAKRKYACDQCITVLIKWRRKRTCINYLKLIWMSFNCRQTIYSLNTLTKS